MTEFLISFGKCKNVCVCYEFETKQPNLKHSVETVGCVPAELKLKQFKYSDYRNIRNTVNLEEEIVFLIPDPKDYER